jgi:hypothetical protein
VDADLGEVELLAAALVAAADVLVEDVVGDREQELADAGVAAVAVLARGAAEEGLADEVGGVVLAGDLVAEEPRDLGEVAVDELVAGPVVAGAPGVEQLRVALHDRWPIASRARAQAGAPA